MAVMVTYTENKKKSKGTESNTILKSPSLWAGCKNHIILIGNNSLNCTPAGCKGQHTAYEDIEQQGAINFIKIIKACNKAREYRDETVEMSARFIK